MSTYRLQFNDGKNVDDKNPNHTRFTLADATALVPYLHEMGITHVYASPLTQAEKGQNHGYGVTDYNRIDDDLGGLEGLRVLSAELKKNGMGLVLDIVPNHMYTSYANEWWRDILEKGRDSAYRDHLEVYWTKDKSEDKEQKPQKILLPFLGGSFNEIFDAGDLKLKKESDGIITLNYWAKKLPLCPESVKKINEAVGDGDVEAYYNKPGNGEDWTHKDELRDIIKMQHYRLAHWRMGFGENGYRRFFDENSLIGVQQELDHVFDDAHKLMKQLIDDKLVDGFRVDHIDGLAYPKRYLARLRELTGPDMPIFVEKIVEGNERLAGLPVEGMTGYESLNAILRLHGDKTAMGKIGAFYQGYTSDHHSFDRVRDKSKELIMHRAFSGEMEALTNRLMTLAHEDDDFTRLAMSDALQAILLNFRVYRSYNEGEELEDQDRQELNHAIEAAKNPERGPPVDCRAIDFVGRVLTGSLSNNEYDQAQINEVVRKFQQLTGPVMARSMEDTAFYRYVANVALNEVGGDPNVVALTSKAFHEENLYRLENMRLTMNTDQTHDTKRGADTRLRIMAALNQFTDDWIGNVRSWTEMNKSPSGQAHPDRNDEYFFYQMLVGSWPADLTSVDDPALPAYRERMVQYMDKALKESKRHTTWTEKNEKYAGGMKAFVERVLDPQNPRSRRFMNQFMTFQQDVAAAAAVDGLNDVVLKTASVGSPDTYEGGELWDLSMVDPDNRRPVDYNLRQAFLDTLKAGGQSWSSLKSQWQNGMIKIAVTQRVLATRRDNETIFRDGKYIPVYGDNREDSRFTSFIRQKGDNGFLIVNPRNTVTPATTMEQLKSLDIGNAYRGVIVHVPSLAGRTLTDEFTRRTFEVPDNGKVDLGELLGDGPVGEFSFGTVRHDETVPPLLPA